MKTKSRADQRPEGAPGEFSPSKPSQPLRLVDSRLAAGQRTGMSANKIGFTFWQDGGFWVGHLDEYPDYATQGTSLEDLKEHLADLHRELTSGAIPNVRRHAELEVA